MSRVGKSPVAIPSGIKYEIKDHELIFKGPKGELRQQINPSFNIREEDAHLIVERPNNQKANRALHGLYRALIQNMINGVNEGFEIVLELVGVGFRAEANGQILDLSLGFSHAVKFVIPKEVTVETEQKKGETPKITLRSIDKQLLGQVAAKIRSIRPPEPYKGKGVRYKNENIRRKAGKAAGKGKK